MVVTVGLMMVVSEACRRGLLEEYFQERELAKAGVCLCSPCASQTQSPSSHCVSFSQAGACNTCLLIPPQKLGQHNSVKNI